MNYIFGNNTLVPRSARAGGGSGGQGSGLGVKQKIGPKRCSSEELAHPHTSSPSTSSPASSSPSSSSSRWQQLLMFFSRRSAFTDCINASQLLIYNNIKCDVKEVLAPAPYITEHISTDVSTGIIQESPIQQ
ncbi:unnamed protein product [Pleuronectes platessa]|uniref:Uncharacterized protein n=1 Tax=Pleuronectes platessa TaxID=8262 RepID=A0A9N7W0A0_PLEPL|nr:unnamed protein product [Pleuronectes platessa]